MNYLPNIILSNIFLALVWISYELLFSKTKNFQANRFFLLGGSVLSVILPWLPLQIKISSQLTTIMALPAFLLKGITVNPSVGAGNPGTALFAFGSLPATIYLIVVILLVTISATQFLRLLIWSKTRPASRWEKHKVVILDKSWSAFSFFRTIYYPAPFEPNSQETGTILEHEKVHANQLHSIDNLLTMIIRILFFYNPIIYLIADKLRLTHEYIADEATAGTDKASYSHTLIRHQFLAPRLMLMHSFNNQSFLKRRLYMLLKTKQTQLAGWKYLLAAPLIGGMILLSGMTSSLLAQVQNKKEKVKETTVGQEKKIEAKEHVKIDEPPMFQGGNMEGFSKWIGENIKYPQKAIDENITGKVYVSFEIITTGEVMNVSVARSANPLLDEEAVRVIKSSPKWKPAQIDGKPASIKMTIPVGFTLDEKKK